MSRRPSPEQQKNCLFVQPGVEWNRNLYGSGILDAEAMLKTELPDALIKDQPA
ncbi:MAG: hypothetical protein KKH74_02215 [Gammaproteobacteria bacterium]|nr:hypothetical protein [Gammaproteobacteria bacterium]MBU1730941.1 hypothetical protein [Gammaproteobacteria bacterium]MBU1893601.1 hypothetical protein [Gammaproteobacteria bacterium]